MKELEENPMIFNFERENEIRISSVFRNTLGRTPKSDCIFSLCILTCALTDLLERPSPVGAVWEASVLGRAAVWPPVLALTDQDAAPVQGGQRIGYHCHLADSYVYYTILLAFLMR